LRKFISQPGELSRGGGFSPVCRQVANFNSLSGQTVRDLRDGYNKITRGIVLTKIYEIFQHGEGLVFRRIAKSRSGARPAPAIAVCTFTIKRRTSIGSAQLGTSTEGEMLLGSA